VWSLRNYQQLAVDDAVSFFDTASPGEKRCYSAPTGTGKSVIELELLRRTPDAVLITPRVEIIAGMLDKLGVKVTLNKAAEVGEAHRIYTPIRLRNLLAAGTVTRPKYLIVDEGHHGTAETYVLLDALLGGIPAVGFTATPFRGTPRSTAAFRDHWGEPVPILTFGEAAGNGYLSVPACSVVPLLDDDLIEVSNGEFIVSELDDAVGGVIPAVVQLAAPWVSEPVPLDTPPLWDRPTMFTVPTVNAARELTQALNAADLPAYTVTGDTSPEARERSFKACIDCRAAIVQVNVVSEGVDLPIRRLVDLRPTLSPVLWMQTLGRITRPTGRGEPAPEYVCCCRNLLRHAYLLEGHVPSGVIASAESSFGGVGKRAGLRVLGFEGLGRFKATELPLADGTTGVMYCLSSLEGSTVTQYTVVASPGKAETLIARRTNKRSHGVTSEWGRWERVGSMPDCSGFASVPPGRLTEKQAAWWKRSAATRGLDPDAKVNARQFQVMPVLFDVRGKLL
jgi:hypothetical protein